MEQFSQHLRLRAEALGLSNAEVARKVGLSERRYSHYVNGKREPDLALIVRIAKALGTTPNEMLGFERTSKGSKKATLIDRLAETANALAETELEIVLVQTQALATRNAGLKRRRPS